MEVVTLGGLIAGACIAGIGSALVQILVWKLGGSILRKRALLFVGSSCLTMDIMRLLPGYTVTDKFGALVLLECTDLSSHLLNNYNWMFL